MIPDTPEWRQRWHDHIMESTDIRWGTEAHHKLGDISRPEGDYFTVEDMDDENFYGQWLTGFGFIHVRFPKDTTREITSDERLWLAERPVVIS